MGPLYLFFAAYTFNIGQPYYEFILGRLKNKVAYFLEA